PDFCGAHGHIFYFLGRNFLNIKIHRLSKLDQIRDVGISISSKTMVIPYDDLFGAKGIDQNILYKFCGRKPGEFFGKGVDNEIVKTSFLKYFNFFLYGIQQFYI
ncbi:MAG: hypothetical protein ACI815_001454, partial [Psychroserpens sp.]